LNVSLERLLLALLKTPLIQLSGCTQKPQLLSLLNQSIWLDRNSFVREGVTSESALSILCSEAILLNNSGELEAKQTYGGNLKNIYKLAMKP
jgi:hypothetical protein